MNFKSILKNVFVLVALVFAVGCGNENEQGIISVSGIGTVVASPDMVRIDLHFKNVSETTEQAKNAVTESVQTVLKILKSENIPDRDVQTISLNYGMETEYKNGGIVYAGQRAEQIIIVTIDDIKNNSEKLSMILDKLVFINNLSIRNITFDIKEKAELFRQSRELAFQKASDKAEQYAELSGRRIIGIQNISESNSRDIQLRQSNTMFFKTSSFDDEYSGIPAGQQEITTEIKVEYKTE